MLRKPLTFGLFFGLASFLSVHVDADAQQQPESAIPTDLRWHVLAENEKAIIDRMAADFYENTLRDAQANAIEDETASIYASGDRRERAKFLAERRDQWRKMSDGQRNALRGAKTPQYENLAEEQKRPFRSHAMDLLDSKGAINESALTSALKSEV